MCTLNGYPFHNRCDDVIPNVLILTGGRLNVVSQQRTGAGTGAMEPISRITSLLEPTRDLTLDASALTSALRKTPNTSGTTNTTVPQIKALLNSRHEREILDGLRRFITLTQSPRKRVDPTLPSELLPTILKNISSPSTHIRKLVYLILIQHAESDQDTALLAINSIQKALSASNPHIRALALRTISSLRVPVIAQIVALGIKRAVGDMSPIVRRTAALSIPKCWKLDPGTSSQLQGYLATLLGDRQYVVVGAACIALIETGLLSTRQGLDSVVSMIHSIYRSLCKKLVDMDEWGQCAALRVLGAYARRCFPRRTKRTKKDTPTSGHQRTASFYGEPEPTDTVPETSTTAEHETVLIPDPDLELLLDSAQPLLQSRNPAVIVAVSRLFLELEAGTNSPSTKTPPRHLSSAIPALVTLLRQTSTPPTTPLALHNILQIALVYPPSFVPHARHFLVRSTDSPLDTAPLKLEVLTLMFPHASMHTQSLILAELSTAARHRTNTSSDLLRAAISGLGRCALSAPPNSPISSRCLALLIEHVKTDAAITPDLASTAASEALTQIRHLIQNDPTSHMTTVIRLAKDLDTTTQPKARAAIIWLVGEYSGTDMSGAVAGVEAGKGNIAADVLRILAKTFAQEAEEVKLQIALLAAKVYVHYLNTKPAPQNEDPTGTIPEDNELETHPIPLLYAYIHSLIRYDTSYTLRDVARMHRALLPPPPLSTAASYHQQSQIPSAAANTQLATLILLAPKPPPVTPSPATARTGLALGSAALVLNDRTLPGYESFELPEWVKEGEEPDPRLRDTGTDVAAGSVGDVRPVPAAERAGAVGEVRVGPPVAKARDLEDWLGEDDGESESESGSGSGSEESSGEGTDDAESSDSDDGEATKLVR